MNCTNPNSDSELSPHKASCNRIGIHVPGDNPTPTYTEFLADLCAAQNKNSLENSAQNSQAASAQPDPECTASAQQCTTGSQRFTNGGQQETNTAEPSPNSAHPRLDQTTKAMIWTKRMSRLKEK